MEKCTETAVNLRKKELESIHIMKGAEKELELAKNKKAYKPDLDCSEEAIISAAKKKYSAAKGKGIQ